MKSLNKWLSRIFLGQLITVQEDVQIAKAVVTDQNGKYFYFTREGKVDNFGSLGIVVWKGTEFLEGYLSDSKRHILVDDEGSMVPVCNISKITRSVQPKLVEYSYRK